MINKIKSLIYQKINISSQTHQEKIGAQINKIINEREGKTDYHMGREAGGGFRMGWTHIYLWPIHADVWQKPSQYFKVIILQLR